MKWTSALQVSARGIIDQDASLFGFRDGYGSEDIGQLMELVAAGSAQDRMNFGAAITEPIMQMIPYVELYRDFFMQQEYQRGEDNTIPIEDIVALGYQSHPSTAIKFVEPGYRFTRPTFSWHMAGGKIHWNTPSLAGWDVLSRLLNYLTWDLARKRDALAKTALDNAIGSDHNLTVSGGSLQKAAVDEIMRESSKIGFPVVQGLVNPGRLMDMAGFTWTIPNIPDSVALDLLRDLFTTQYGTITWRLDPNAEVDTIYIAGPKEMVGYQQNRNVARTDTDVDIVEGMDIYTIRDNDIAHHVVSDLALWKINIAS